MQKPIIIALLAVIALTLIVWGFTIFVQPSLSPVVKNNLYYLFLALISTITVIGFAYQMWGSRKIGKAETIELDPIEIQRHRQNMLDNVSHTWIDGFLDKSLYKKKLIDLGLASDLELVENPWDIQVQMPKQESQLLPSGTKILDVFERMRFSMLILGEPGAGKTTMLLELAKQAISRLGQTQNSQSRWFSACLCWTPALSIANWLVDELRGKYYVPTKIGRRWIENNALMLLLDSLDEVVDTNREACIQAINAFLQEHSAPLAVCSRRQEYEASNAQLKLQGAVTIQPLDDKQVKKYMGAIGTRFIAPYKSLVQRTEEVGCTKEEQDFLHTPLFLSILVMAYQDAPIADKSPLSLQ